MTDLRDRQRAPLKQLSRCLEDRTRIELSLSEISDEADNGQKELNCNSQFSCFYKMIMGLMALTRFHSPIRIMHGVHLKMIVKTK